MNTIEKAIAAKSANEELVNEITNYCDRCNYHYDYVYTANSSYPIDDYDIIHEIKVTLCKYVFCLNIEDIFNENLEEERRHARYYIQMAHIDPDDFEMYFDHEGDESGDIEEALEDMIDLVEYQEQRWEDELSENGYVEHEWFD